MPKLNETQQKELDRMRNVVLTILEFSIKHSESNPFLQEQALVIARQTYERGNLRGMKAIYKDMREMAAGMAPARYAELKELLLKKFGETLP